MQGSDVRSGCHWLCMPADRGGPCSFPSTLRPDSIQDKNKNWRATDNKQHTTIHFENAIN